MGSTMQRLLSFGQEKAAGASSTLACPVVVKGKTQEHQFKIKELYADSVKDMLSRFDEACVVTKVTHPKQLAERAPCPLFINERSTGTLWKCIYMGVWGSQNYLRVHSKKYATITDLSPSSLTYNEVYAGVDGLRDADMRGVLVPPDVKGRWLAQADSGVPFTEEVAMMRSEVLPVVLLSADWTQYYLVVHKGSQEFAFLLKAQNMGQVALVVDYIREVLLLPERFFPGSLSQQMSCYCNGCTLLHLQHHGGAAGLAPSSSSDKTWAGVCP